MQAFHSWWKGVILVWSIHVEHAVDKVAMRQVFLRALRRSSADCHSNNISYYSGTPHSKTSNKNRGFAMGLFFMWILNLTDQRAWYGLAEWEELKLAILLLLRTPNSLSPQLDCVINLSRASLEILTIYWFFYKPIVLPETTCSRTAVCSRVDPWWPQCFCSLCAVNRTVPGNEEQESACSWWAGTRRTCKHHVNCIWSHWIQALTF